MTYSHVKQFVEFKGVDMRSSDLTRPRGFAPGSAKNFQHSAKGGLQHRFGSKIVDTDAGQTGIFYYEATDMTGTKKQELICFGADTLANSYQPYRIAKQSFVLTNSHASADATVSHYYDEATSQFRFKVLRGGATLIDQALGSGMGGGAYTLSSLQTAINALTSFSVGAIINAANVPAAFMEIIADQTVTANGGTLTVYYEYAEAINFPGGSSSDYATCKNSYSAIGQSLMRNVSCAQVNGVLYISPGSTDSADGNVESAAKVLKYDGQDVYRAGFPAADMAAMTLTAGSGGTATTSLTDAIGTRNIAPAVRGTYSWMVTLVRVDKIGNRVESARCSISSINTEEYGSTFNIEKIELGNYTQFKTAANGYGYKSAQASASHSGVLTLNVDSGHTMEAGDIAFFYDSSQGRFIQRLVTSITATTIVISSTSFDSDQSSLNYDDGGNVSTNDNALITNNFRLAIYRTKSNGAQYYLEEERPFGNAIEYLGRLDTNLGGAWIEPLYSRDEPPAGKYLATFNNQLIISGVPNAAQTVYFSDEGPEYFPRGSHEFDLPSSVTGVHQTAEVLACATANSLHVAAGDLLNFQFRVNQISDKIGCTSHHAMVEAMEGLLMFPSYRGPYVLAGGRALEPLGATISPDGSKASRLEPYFTQKYGPTGEKPIFERCHAAVLPNESLYVLYVPVEDQAKPCFDTGSGVAFVYDYSRDAWYRWTGVNMAGGLAAYGDDLYWTSRLYDGSGTVNYSNMLSRIYQRQSRKGKYNYADHTDYIDFDYRAQWEMLGNPDFDKRPIRISIRSHETRDHSAMVFTLKTFLDFDETLVSSNNTLTWNATEKALKPKLKSPICKAVQVSFQSQRYYNPAQITGYLLELMAEYQKEVR